ncbi:rod shape-determining protein MreC [Nocardioides psychrotolerans]|uniref:Cell shape-determining protein MreC n=1 Tax=Nocardioides psychrotolerans TaxID=1005945 RepID=A0A1I3CJ37_9ACTN|nr:rod shape-determining protein MreC [Nocardioides psychrotolerans]GEP40231.1 rod shape-determining protein MreC [Nocardioides psychrotolerans]SFH74373.1 rod shape-determining protein MreC [Nocardioides psychrotolerans]
MALDLHRERRWGSADSSPGRGQPPRALVVALLLACATLITLDYHGGSDSPVEPVRRALGEVYGPVEVTAAAVVRPVTAIPRWFSTHDTMRAEIDDLEAENAALRQQVNTSGYDRNKLAEYDGLTAAAGTLGYALVPARVVGMGPSQSFSSTVTIDAGARSGLRPDMTVVNNDGLVGRILRVTATTATVLLLIDADSVVGGRVGESMEIGMLHGRGVLGDEGRLDLDLIDESVVPRKFDTVVTWGSESGAPYVAGVPVGRISTVFSNLRDSSQRAVIEPFVDFGALDLVGVVVPSGTSSDRAVIEADGSLR